MIITVSRQFGSGGREVGKRLADALGYEYFDRQLVTEIAKKADLDEAYVSNVLEKGGYRNYAFSFSRSIPLVASTPTTVTDVLVAQQRVIRAVGGKGNCVIVGRSADAILKDLQPFRIFVYADEAAKLERCRQRAHEGEDVSDKVMLKKLKEIDGGRRKLHDLFSATAWGDKDGYDLMLNTSRLNIKETIPALVSIVKSYAGK